MNGTVLSFNSDNSLPYFKNKRPELVKWVEPLPSDKPNVNKFCVVFDDGCIYIYEKDVSYAPKEDYTQSMIKLPDGNKPSHVSKADVIVKMQKVIENFDFE